MKRHAAPIFAAILLLLPVLYVGSYLALVDPYGDVEFYELAWKVGWAEDVHYKVGGRWANKLFWPLEQIDRKVRPEAWEQDDGFRSWRAPTLPPLISPSPARST